LLEDKSGKMVTNLEYQNARDARLPVFVFVRRTVEQMLPVWRKNQTGDFSPHVDYPEVFRFLDSIYKENRWVFSFEKTAEITEILTTQLSVMIRDLLTRNRAGTLQLLSEFLPISAKAEELAREKPEYWEFLLTAERLSVQLAGVRYRANRIRAGATHVKLKRVNALEFFDIVRTSFSELLAWSSTCLAQLPRITAAWGPPGESGDARNIKRAVSELIELCDHLVRWEEDVLVLAPPDGALKLKSTMQGLAEFLLRELETLPQKILAPFADGAQPTGNIHIQLTFQAPPVAEFEAEIERLSQDPRVLFESE